MLAKKNSISLTAMAGNSVDNNGNELSSNETSGQGLKSLDNNGIIVNDNALAANDFGSNAAGSTGPTLSIGTTPGVAAITTAAAAATGGIGFMQDPGPSPGIGGEVEECIRTRKLWWESQTIRRFFRICALLSLVSVSMNTPYTFSQMSSLIYITFIIDIFVTLAFTIELISKVKIRGTHTYFHDRWSQFDIFMLFCLITSLILHSFEITGKSKKIEFIVYYFKFNNYLNK